MPLWLEIAKGPLFRFAMAVFILGLLRLLILTLWGMSYSIRQAGDQRIPYAKILRETLGWILPFGQLLRTRRVYSFASFGMHLGVLGVSFFLGNHLDILQANIGLSWVAVYKPVLDWLALLTILAGVYLLLHRIYIPSSQQLSKWSDYVLLVLILNLFISGFLAGQAWNPIPYDPLMLFHTLNGIMIALITPFTKIAHCVLFPLIRLGSEIAWRVTPEGGSRTVRTLYGSEGRRI